MESLIVEVYFPVKLFLQENQGMWHIVYQVLIYSTVHP